MAVGMVASPTAVAMDPVITPAPELLKRQASSTSVDPALEGYYIKDISHTESITCNTWTTSGKYGNCCTPGSSCVLPTACVSNNLIRQGSSTPCGGNVCNTITVFSQSPPAPGSSVLVLACMGSGWSAWTLYRETPAATTSSAPSSLGSLSSSATATSTSPAPAGKPSQNNAWIAGAVVGPVVVVVVIAALLFWVFTLRRRLASSTGSGSSSAHLQHATYGDPRLVQPYMRHSEMDAASPVHLSTSAMPGFNSPNEHSTLSE
ncbi:MAG: hypothetical protein M1813_005510 [Trichoglossum hirsutum]|nr:MAG: hypothetical protein M1813_005510 [Trichoglossum hirsutum]